MDVVLSTLPAPSVGAALSQWTVQPLAILAVLLVGVWYARTVRALPGWPTGRVVMFALGLVLVLWTTCGFAGSYAGSLFWVWTAQQLGLLLVVPMVLLSGGPLRLVTADSFVMRVLRSGPARLLANPLVGPAFVPLLSVVLFFGPLPRWCVDVPVLGWVEQLAVVLAGLFIALPFAGTDDPPSSLRVGLALAIGSFELVLDAIPGIALRLHNSLTTSWFDVRDLHAWTPSALSDQRIAGSVLWCTAELLDLPFLLLVFRQWVRADARDAAQVDAVLAAERAARSEPDDNGRDEPWWVTDPTWRRPR